MRTTIRIDDDLLAEAKKVAAASRRTLTQVIEDALRESLARRPSGESQHMRLTTVGGRGPRAGVDLDDSAALLEVMERERAPY